MRYEPVCLTDSRIVQEDHFSGPVTDGESASRLARRSVVKTGASREGLSSARGTIPTESLRDDPQVGRWTQAEALARKYPGWSPYVNGLVNHIK
ncbi:MAG: hypothetical protein ACETWG_13335 [Candidatus Neomarinimicrobiota bacterium]